MKITGLYNLGSLSVPDTVIRRIPQWFYDNTYPAGGQLKQVSEHIVYLTISSRILVISSDISAWLPHQTMPGFYLMISVIL